MLAGRAAQGWAGLPLDKRK